MLISLISSVSDQFKLSYDIPCFVQLLAGAKLLEVGDSPKDRAVFNGAQKCKLICSYHFMSHLG